VQSIFFFKRRQKAHISPCNQFGDSDGVNSWSFPRVELSHIVLLAKETVSGFIFSGMSL